MKVKEPFDESGYTHEYRNKNVSSLDIIIKENGVIIAKDITKESGSKNIK